LTHNAHVRPLSLGGSVLAIIAATMLLSALMLAAPSSASADTTRGCPSAYGSGQVIVTDFKLDRSSANPADWTATAWFTVSGEAAQCQISLASYELPGDEFSVPQSLHDGTSAMAGAGDHQLTVSLPGNEELAGCFFQVELLFGPVLQTITETERYGSRVIVQKITGAETCGGEGEEGGNPPPGEGTQGGNPPTGPLLPDTALGTTVDRSVTMLLLGALLVSMAGVARLSAQRS
jgi:hypothetical protein